MDLKSPHDAIPADLVYTPEALAETARDLEQLATATAKQALELMEKASARQTAETSAQVIGDEAIAFLRELLLEPDEVGVLDTYMGTEREWRTSLEQALAADVVHSLEKVDREWLEMRARDLSRAMATFWWNLDPESNLRRSSLGRRILKGDPIEQREDLTRLAERFGLTFDEGCVLLETMLMSVVAHALDELTAPTADPEHEDLYSRSR